MGHDPRYLKGIEFFNQGHYFEAHEIWEELWHAVAGAPADFLKGLIQSAVALHHFERGNLKGALSLYRTSRKLLASCEEFFWGLNVGNFIKQMDACLKPLDSFTLEDLPGCSPGGHEKRPLRFGQTPIPKIKLSVAKKRAA